MIKFTLGSDLTRTRFLWS